MRRILVLALVVLGFGGAIASQAIDTVRAQGDHAALVEIDGAIQPLSARFLARAIDTATEDNAEVLIVLLDTPRRAPGLYAGDGRGDPRIPGSGGRLRLPRRR